MQNLDFAVFRVSLLTVQCDACGLDSGAGICGPFNDTTR